MAQLLVRLAARHEVALLYLRAANEPPLDPQLHERCIIAEEVARPVAASRALQRVRQLIGLLRGRPVWATDWAVPAFGARTTAFASHWRPDIVQVEFHIMAQYLGPLRHCPAPRILTEHDPGWPTARERWRTARGRARLVSYADLLAWRRFEAAAFRRVQALVVFTERDQRALRPLAGGTPIVHIPLAVEPRPRAPFTAGEECPALLFVGNFMHPPNVDAADRLAEAILPRIRREYPSAWLQLVGDEPPTHLQGREDEHIAVTGRVPNVGPYLDGATIVVVPLRLGGGMRVKILEALATGKAIVASPLAVAGLDVRDGVEVVLAESDQQFSDAVLALLTDPQRRRFLASRAHVWATKHLGWERPLAAYEALYASVLARER